MDWRPRILLSAAAVLLCLPAAADEFGDPVAGQQIYRQCRNCHEIGSGAEHRIGPHLNGLFGRKAASLSDFRYSNALQRAGTTGLAWHAETLDAFLENPGALASGTRMSFKGIDNRKDRLDVIAYLRTFADSPSNIPEADPTATLTDHGIDPAILAFEGDAEYGEYLSSECTTCHRTTGADDGIPSIVLWPEEDFVIAMHAYKNKNRPNPVMQMIAGRLNGEEIAALAAYFATLEE